MILKKNTLRVRAVARKPRRSSPDATFNMPNTIFESVLWQAPRSLIRCYLHSTVTQTTTPPLPPWPRSTRLPCMACYIRFCCQCFPTLFGIDQSKRGRYYKTNQNSLRAFLTSCFFSFVFSVFYSQIRFFVFPQKQKFEICVSLFSDLLFYLLFPHKYIKNGGKIRPVKNTPPLIHSSHRKTSS